MKKGSNAIFTSILLGAALSLSACNGLFENIYDDPIESEQEVGENKFSQINATEYDQWVYIDLSELKTTTVKIGEEYDSEIPAEWDFAIHRYDIKTNGGATYETSYTTLDDFLANGTLPQEGDFTADVWTTEKIAIDMSGMMENNIKYTESDYNAVFSQWLDVDTSTMPPIYTMSGKVYLLRLKDNTYAAIYFTNYMNARGVKGYIDFEFQYPLDLNGDNE